MTSMAMLYRYAGRLDEAVRMAERARDIRAAADSIDLAPSLTELGLVLLARGQDGKALTELTAALAQYTSKRNVDEPDYFTTRAALALAQLRVGEPDALSRLDTALADLRQRHPEPSNALAETLNLRAKAAAVAGDNDDAVWRQQELDTLTALLGTDHPRTRTARREAANARR